MHESALPVVVHEDHTGTLVIGQRAVLLLQDDNELVEAFGVRVAVRPGNVTELYEVDIRKLRTEAADPVDYGSQWWQLNVRPLRAGGTGENGIEVQLRCEVAGDVVPMGLDPVLLEANSASAPKTGAGRYTRRSDGERDTPDSLMM